MPDLPFQSATDLVHAIKTRKIKSSELLELYIERMQKHNPKINAIVAPYLKDQTAIHFAGLIENNLGGFVAPPGYA